MPSRKCYPLWLVLVLGTLLTLPFALALSLSNSLSHDEEQHIAAGVLFARDGLLPYRDFPYFHVPYLVYAYGALFKCTGQFLLATRLFSAACAALTGGAIFAAAWAILVNRAPWKRLAIGAGAVALLVTAPVFYNTVGHSWNQEPSVLLALVSFLSLHAALARPLPAWGVFLSGVLLGLSVGFRITLAPLVLPFAIWLWVRAGDLRVRLRLLVIFAAALALALLPLALAWRAAPAGFLFGNVEFPRVNIEYRMATGEPRTMTLPKKLRFFFKEVMRPNWAVFYGFLTVLGAWWLYFRKRQLRWPRVVLFLFLSLPFWMMGALAPSPTFDQYYYPLVPLLIVGMLALLAEFPSRAQGRSWAWGALGACVVLTALLTGTRYTNLQELFEVAEWDLTQARYAVHELRAVAPPGRVLTLAPALPLEAGMQIYPEFSTGPFAWRVASLIAPERRSPLRLLAPDDLAARLEKDPPVSILLGFEKTGEEPFAAYAQSHGYQKFKLRKDEVLWVAPWVQYRE